MYLILIFLTRGGSRCTQSARTAALNSACPSFGRNAVRPLRRDLRGAILSPLRHTGLDDVSAVGGAGRSGPLAVPPLRHLVRRELLPAVRPPEGRLGSPAGSPVLRPAHPHDPVEARDRRIRPVRGHGLRGTRRQPEPAGPEHSTDAFRSNREQRHGLQWELELRFMGNRVEPYLPRERRGSPRGLRDDPVRGRGAPAFFASPLPVARPPPPPGPPPPP